MTNICTYYHNLMQIGYVTDVLHCLNTVVCKGSTVGVWRCIPLCRPINLIHLVHSLILVCDIQYVICQTEVLLSNVEQIRYFKDMLPSVDTARVACR